MSLSDLLQYRRAVRHFDAEQPIDAEKVKHCLQLATLAPTSSNMQLYEFYHILDRTLLAQLAEACLNQRAATTAQQMVVFVTRQDLHKQRAEQVLQFEIENVKRHSSAERQAKRIKDKKAYYGKLMPFVYTRCFGVLGLFRKLLTKIISLRRPICTEVSESDIVAVTHKSCALVVQTFMLAMAEQGYDTCPLEGFDSKRVKKLLDLPHDCEINMILPCGIRKANHGIWGDRYRVPFEQVYRSK
ncbi:nitroreductase family protein [Pasteurellaceae bacterium 22721_9_1]